MSSSSLDGQSPLYLPCQSSLWLSMPSLPKREIRRKVKRRTQFDCGNCPVSFLFILGSGFVTAVWCLVIRLTMIYLHVQNNCQNDKMRNKTLAMSTGHFNGSLNPWNCWSAWDVFVPITLAALEKLLTNWTCQRLRNKLDLPRISGNCNG